MNPEYKPTVRAPDLLIFHKKLLSPIRIFCSSNSYFNISQRRKLAKYATALAIEHNVQLIEFLRT